MKWTAQHILWALNGIELSGLQWDPSHGVLPEAAVDGSHSGGGPFIWPGDCCFHRKCSTGRTQSPLWSPTRDLQQHFLLPPRWLLQCPSQCPWWRLALSQPLALPSHSLSIHRQAVVSMRFCLSFSLSCVCFFITYFHCVFFHSSANGHACERGPSDDAAPPHGWGPRASPWTRTHGPTR